MHLRNFEKAVENTQQQTHVLGYLSLREVFVTCFCLHNFLLDVMVWNNIWVGRGYPIGDDGLWLDGHTLANNDKTERFLAIKFGLWRALLAKHLQVFCKKEPIPE